MYGYFPRKLKTGFLREGRRTKVERAKAQQMEKLSKINKVKMTPTNVCEQ